MYRDRLDNLNTKKQIRLEILSQNRKDLHTQVARIKQTIEKILDKDASFAERIRTLFKEQGISIFSILTAFSMTIATIVLALTRGRGSGEPGGPPSKDEGTFMKNLTSRQFGEKIFLFLDGRCGQGIKGITWNINNPKMTLKTFYKPFLFKSVKRMDTIRVVQNPPL